MVLLPVNIEPSPQILDEMDGKLPVRIRLIQFDDPLIEAFIRLLEKFQMIMVQFLNQIVDITHHIGKNENSYELTVLRLKLPRQTW
jgi:hypothetical protein